MFKFGRKKHPDDGKTPEQLASEKKARELQQKLESKKKKVEDREKFKVHPNFIFEDGYTLLERAIINKELDEVQRLLSAGADPNFSSSKEETCLGRAMKTSGSVNLSLTEVLLKAGANPNSLEKGQKMPLLTTAMRGNVQNCEEMVELLLQNGADINAHTEGDPTYSSVYQAYRYEGKRFELMLKHGGDIFAIPEGCDPVWKSVVYNGNHSKFKLLVKYTDQKLRLHELFNRYVEKSYGENSNQHIYYNELFSGEAVRSPTAFKNPKSGQSFFHDMVEQKKHQKMHAILQHNDYQDSQNCKGQTPLHVAASVDDVESIALLLKQGADVNKVDNVGFTPLDILAAKEFTGGASEKFLRAQGGVFKVLDPDQTGLKKGAIKTLGPQKLGVPKPANNPR